MARNRIFDDNDSIMDLLRTSHSSTSLVICPEKRGNLARFLNGINNSKKDALQKKNVNFIRWKILRMVRFQVLDLTLRVILEFFCLLPKILRKERYYIMITMQVDLMNIQQVNLYDFCKWVFFLIRLCLFRLNL